MNSDLPAGYASLVAHYREQGREPPGYLLRGDPAPMTNVCPVCSIVTSGGWALSDALALRDDGAERNEVPCEGCTRYFEISRARRLIERLQDSWDREDWFTAGEVAKSLAGCGLALFGETSRREGAEEAEETEETEADLATALRCSATHCADCQAPLAFHAPETP